MSTRITRFISHSDYKIYIMGNDALLPNISACNDDHQAHYNPKHDYSQDYFTLATDNGSEGVFTINKPSDKSIDYSIDNGLTWTTTTAYETSITASKVLIKSNDRNNYWTADQDTDGINCSINFHVEGNIMSLLYGDDFIDKYVVPNYTFADLFTRSTNLTSAKKLILPATTLGESCYYYMFNGCTSLTIAPELPATTLANYCYQYMFEGCTSLTAAPELPATTLVEGCYSYMFYGCTSLVTMPKLPAITLADYCYYMMFYNCTILTTAPELPATTLAQGCYYEMFRDCTSLITTPVLHATTLAISCYSGMFKGCTSLTIAPILPATQLARYCYANMFYGCTSLNSITCLATDISANSCTSNWVDDVAASGTFIKHPSMNNWQTGVNGVPTGWSTTDAVSENYLTFNILSDGIINWKTTTESTTVKTISYSINNGEWTDITSSVSGTSFNVSTGDKVRFKGNNNAYAMSTGNYNTFNGSTASFNLEGNIMSLVNDTLFDYITVLNINFNFCYLFTNINIIRANNLILPATTLDSCYYGMFYGCTSLTTPPELPAIILANSCYSRMFENCTSLTTAPELPATILARSCYNRMFFNCTNLTATPELPATVLASTCYYEMFKGCTSLKTAPDELPATTLSYDCYGHMFQGCTSLKTAPELPATTLTEYCYYEMFNGCTSLTIAPELPATTLANGCYQYMFKGCTRLITVPSTLPATTLAYYCYDGMFYGCISLTTAPELPATTLAYYCYYDMFYGCTNLTTAPQLPATTLANNCYDEMFKGCTSLTTAPELPATTLANNCYDEMFKGCTSLTTAPELPATTLANDCYHSMFANCTNLTSTPELPATTLANYCYNNMFLGCKRLTTVPELPATILSYTCYSAMFQGCTSLTTAPELPATTLAEYCYYGMFQGCTSLTIAPELPATILANDCYSFMFSGCTNLIKAPELHATILRQYCYQCMFRNCTNINSITCLATNISAESCTDNWVYNIASTGTFIKADNMNDWTIGNNGIPINWDVEDYYTNKYFTTVARENGTISFNIWESMGTEYITSISYSTNNGNTWNTTNNTNNKSENIVINVNVNAGDKVMWKCDAVQYAYYNSMSEDYESSFFSSTCEFDAQGNIMSLLYGDNFNNKITLEDSYTFCKLFSDYKHQKTCKIVNANNLILPATSLADGCYQYMFLDCTYLETAPELPATILSDYCYWGMFNGCTSLETVPELPATTLTNSCYCEMFCDCTSLTKAPELLAATLTSSCYHGMFGGCTSLNSITCLATDISASNCTYHWVDDVATTGTFIKQTSMSNWTTGRDGIPENWNIRNYGNNLLTIYVDDYPQGRLNDDYNETVEEVMNKQLNALDENYVNRYDYTGETIIYNGNTYYLWEIPNGYPTSSDVLYLLTTTINSNTLYSQSLEDDLTNHFTSFAGRLDEDKEEMYMGDTAIGTEYELRLVKVIGNYSESLRIWIDDFPQDDHGDLDGEPVEDVMQMSVEDPEVLGNNPYDYTGETIEYNGNTYYLWEAVSGYNADNSCSRYFVTTTVDFNTLYNQSLENNLSNHFTAAIGIFDDSKDMYWEQGINPDDGTDNHYLVKVEML